MKDYLIQSNDYSVPETVEKTKAKAITTAKQMAKETGTAVTVQPCVDGEPNDLAPHYIIKPSGELTIK